MGLFGGKGKGLSGYVNSIGGLVGLGGGQGEYYKPSEFQSDAYNALQSDTKALGNDALASIIGDYSQGKANLDDIIKSGRTNDINQASLQQALAYNPLGGQRLASDMVRNDPTLGLLFGKDGSMGRAAKEEQDLASRGFSLQPEDFEAYGQGSGNIARMFGQQEQSLAQALADRGLASGSNTAAGQQFAGLQGNKFEHLAQLQRQIADDRMARNQQRLSQTRDYLSNLGQQANTAQNTRFNQQMVGAGARQGELESQRNFDLNKYQTQEQLRQAETESKKANENLSLMDAISGGLFQGVQSGIGKMTSSAIGGAGGAGGGGGGMPGGMSGSGGSQGDISGSYNIKQKK